MISTTTKSADDTQSLAAALVDAVDDRDLVVLAGEVGSGKTTFTQGFGRALGVAEPITSPTFILMRTYDGRIPLHHVDIYRIDYLQEVVDLGLLELLDEGGVALMEWGDMAAPVLPRDFLEVRLEIDEADDNVRHIRLRGAGPTWAMREKVVRECVAQWLTSDENEGEETL